jgi:protein-tyrosine phosphatase
MSTRRIILNGIHNLRDIGGYAHADGVVTGGRFWRSDSLHDLDEAGVAHLAGLGLLTVIDLRQNDETSAQPNPFAGRVGNIAYHNAPIFAGLNLNDPEIIDSEDPLFALYCSAIAERSERFRAIMRLIAEAPEGGVLFHCTVGKDRTGMVAAMLLKLAGVSDADIVADYAETSLHIGPVLDALRARAEAAGWDVARMSRYWRSDATTMERFLAHIETAHGGVAAYLQASGLHPAELEVIRHRLTAPAATSSGA